MCSITLQIESNSGIVKHTASGVTQHQNMFGVRFDPIRPDVLVIVSGLMRVKLIIDSSDVGTGSVLVQEASDGLDHPVSYFSKKFLKYQKNYSVVEKETLGLVLALEHFDVYLGSTPFKIKVNTDHNPLTFLKTMKNKNQRLVRWSLALQEYNLEIQHIPGSENVVADALSRCIG